jgi:hypothetical protein
MGLLQGGRQVDARVGTTRAFEHSLKRKADHRPYFEPLMRVSFRHSYYNRFDDACPDLGVRPTLFSQYLMHSLGLVFKDEGGGFSVFYNQNRKTDLESYLRRQGATEEQFWTRLSFVLWSRSPYFINVTDIPINLNPTDHNFYFTNQEAHAEPDLGVVLNPGEAVGPGPLLSVIPSQYPVPVPSNVAGVMVRAISGEVVLCEPRCLPVSEEPHPLGPDCREWLARPQPASSDRCRDVIYLDFSLLPEDKYTIECITDDGEIQWTEERLYTTEVPTPLCFVDLLFSRPMADAEGIYPVRNLAAKDETTINSVDYVLNFEARSTFWNYYIVPQPPEVEFDDLEIKSLLPYPNIRFIGPAPVVLANGAPAYRFVSDQPLRLEQQSSYRFRLHGRRRDDRRLDDDTLLDRLPVASNLQVLPQTDATANQHVRRLRDPGTTRRSTSPTRAGAAAGTRNYSDIYVYV